MAAHRCQVDFAFFIFHLNFAFGSIHNFMLISFSFQIRFEVTHKCEMNNPTSSALSKQKSYMILHFERKEFGCNIHCEVLQWQCLHDF